jgi:hypothetical protein
MLEVEKTLNKFGTNVKKDAKKNLKSKGALYKSIDYNVKVNRAKPNVPPSFEFDFVWEDYGDYIDKGVAGVGGTKADGSRWKKKKVVGSKYKYKDKQPPRIAFNGWTIRRGIAPRSSGGQFQKRTGLLHAIAKSVYHTGLETTHFFTKPFNKYFKTLPDEVLKAYGDDLDIFLKKAL